MKKTWRITLFLALIPLLLFLYILLFTRMEPERDPRYSDIKLDFAPSTTSAQLKDFLSEKAPYQQAPNLADDLSYKLHNPSVRDSKGWYKDLNQAQNILKKHATFRDQFLNVIKKKSCLPQSPPIFQPKGKKRTKRISLLPLIRGSKLVATQALADTQAGNPDAAAQALHQTLRSLLFIEKNCAHELVREMVLLASLRFLSDMAPYPLSHPKLSASHKEALLQTMKTHAEMSSQGIANTWRVERAYMAGMVKELNKHQKNATGIPTYSLVWPLWDEKQFIRWKNELHRYHVWVAQQPFLRTPPHTKMDEFLKKISAKANNPISYISYNAIGRILFNVARPSFLRIQHRWHQHLCFARFQLTRAYKQLGRKDAVPLHPVSQTPFALNEAASCGIQVKNSNPPAKQPKKAAETFPTFRFYAWPSPTPTANPATPSPKAPQKTP